MDKKIIHMYTDGSAKGNPGIGGYGLILIHPHTGYKKEFYEGFKLTTNNRMELLGIIVGLEKLKNPGYNVQIWTDSQYVVNSVEKGWVFSWQKTNFKGKANADLWKRFLTIYAKHHVKLNWVKGHAGHVMNERCDTLANIATTYAFSIDEGYVRTVIKRTYNRAAR